MSLEKVWLFIIVPLINIDGNKRGADRNLRRPVVKEERVVKLELANLVSHVVNSLVLVVIKDSQIPLHALDWPWKIIIEAHLYQDISFELN